MSEIYGTEKIERMNEECIKMVDMPNNDLDKYLKGVFKNYYFGDTNLWDFYKSNKFNSFCTVGSMVCSLNLYIECYLVRGYLLPEYDGEKFFHGWIETTYKGEEYVIDTSLARAIPKEIYYESLEPDVYVKMNRDELYINDYVIYVKDQLKRQNNLNLINVYYKWWVYEDNWLNNIDDNSLILSR